MERSIKFLSVTVILIAGAGCGWFQKPSQEGLAELWLNSSCVGEEYNSLIEQIRDRAAELEPLFTAAFHAGPPPEQQQALAGLVEQNWSRIQVQLAEPEIYRLKDEAYLKTISLPDQKRRARERFEVNYRSAAIVALGITYGAPAQALLQKISTDPSSRYRSVAAVVLAQKVGLNKR